MEAIGQLTGGVAHDFNNLLTAVIGSLELMRKRLPADHRNLLLIDNAMQAARRGATLTQRMLAFARRQELDPELASVRELVAGMTTLFDHTLGPAIVLDVAPTGEGRRQPARNGAAQPCGQRARCHAARRDHRDCRERGRGLSQLVELVAAIRRERPSLPVLRATGHAELPDSQMSGIPRLQKPFLQAHLDHAIAAVMRVRLKSS